MLQDAAGQITGANNLRGSGGTSGLALDDLNFSDSGTDTADYSNLYRADTSITLGATGISLSWSGEDSNGYSIGTVIKGAERS